MHAALYKIYKGSDARHRALCEGVVVQMSASDSILDNAAMCACVQSPGSHESEQQS